MLEDDIIWVTRKALKALDLAPAEAASHAGLDPVAVLAFTRGQFRHDIALGLAPVLGLDPRAFAALPLYQPRIPDLPGLTRLEFPFHDGSVNAWLVQAGPHAILVDTGGDHHACASALDRAGVDKCDCFVTHGHGDHTGGLAGLGPRCSRLFVPARAGGTEGTVLTAGDEVACGPLRVRVIDLDGHWPGALGYRIDGLALPLCAVGDALFAGSVGGTPDPATHRRALDRIRAEVFTLPSTTILLPGHGPATTVANETASNPFLANAATPPVPGNGV